MEARAYLNYVRISPRKVSIVLDLIRNKPCDLSLAILKHTPKAACEPLEKLLKSAMANAENNHNMDVSKLYVAECSVSQGPTLKRIRPRAQGRAFRINKKTSHITLVLKEKGGCRTNVPGRISLLFIRQWSLADKGGPCSVPETLRGVNAMCTAYGTDKVNNTLRLL